MKEKKYSYLTGPNSRWGNFICQISVTADEAEEINAALAIMRKAFPEGTMSKALKSGLALIDGTVKIRDCNEHTLDLLDSYDSHLIAESSRKELRMALKGCPTATAREFTGELSPEYIARYGDE